MHLHSHCLIIVDQRSLLLLVDPNLLNKVFCCDSLLSRLLAESQSLVSFDELAPRVDDDSLELVSLSDQLLAICIDLLLKLQVLFEQGVPLALALALSPLVLLKQPSELAELLRLSLKEVREVIGLCLIVGTAGLLHGALDSLL